MTPGHISRRVAADRIAWVEAMLDEIRALPLDDRQAFFSERYFDFLPVARLMRRAYFEHMERDLRRRKVLADGQTG
jgi:hypothetical protein